MLGFFKYLTSRETCGFVCRCRCVYRDLGCEPLVAVHLFTALKGVRYFCRLWPNVFAREVQADR